MDRRTKNRMNETYAGKSSFSAPPSPRTQNRTAVKNAINESLSAVHFNAQDMRAVLKGTRTPKRSVSSKRRRFRFRADLVFTFAILLMVALPLSRYAIKSKEDIKTIVTTPAESPPTLSTSSSPAVDVVTPLPTVTADVMQDSLSGTSIGESEAIRIARECFTAQCDTSIFTFEEYEVSVSYSASISPQYTVTLESIYKNGCSFAVILNAENGEILQYSSPKLATVPAFIDSSSAEVRAWYDKYGNHLFTWPQDVQAEFSRRYQGATLRTAKENEITYEEAISAVSKPLIDQLPGIFSAFYPVLYSERASSGNRAYYVVYCYAQEVTEELPKEEPMTVSFDAETGDIISIEGNPLSESLSIQSFLKAN